jgi:hypothetical protein
MNATDESENIPPPGRPVTDLAYDGDCKTALEPRLSDLLEMAVAAGWDRRKAAYALMFLAARHVTGTPVDTGPAAA